MTRVEWESLCDGCAKCCLLKFEDEKTAEIFYSDVACRLLDLRSCRCRDYANRKARVPDCVVLNPRNLKALSWMPSTCAYKLVAQGKDLPDWHPLVSKDRRSVHRAGVSVRGRCVSERDVSEEEAEERIIDWA